MAGRKHHNGMQPLPSLIRASAWDAANAQMRAANRTAWTEDDYNLACETQNRLVRSCYGKNGDNQPELCFIRFQIAESMQKAGLFTLDSDLDEVRAEIDRIVAA